MFRPPSLTGWNVLLFCTFLPKTPFKYFEYNTINYYYLDAVTQHTKAKLYDVRKWRTLWFSSERVFSSTHFFLVVLIGFCNMFFVHVVFCFLEISSLKKVLFSIFRCNFFCRLELFFYSFSSSNILEISMLRQIFCYTCNVIVHYFINSVTN